MNLVLTDGRQFRLPAGPDTGWLGHPLAAALSPDGWWLGYRVGRFVGDQTYQLRSLATGRIHTVTGTPQAWSADGRRVALWEEELPYLPDGAPPALGASHVQNRE